MSALRMIGRFLWWCVPKLPSNERDAEFADALDRLRLHARIAHERCTTPEKHPESITSDREGEQ